jgi:hypothetical protein
MEEDQNNEQGHQEQKGKLPAMATFAFHFLFLRLGPVGLIAITMPSCRVIHVFFYCC